jgi:hypothetical protein
MFKHRIQDTETHEATDNDEKDQWNGINWDAPVEDGLFEDYDVEMNKEGKNQEKPSPRE